MRLIGWGEDSPGRIVGGVLPGRAASVEVGSTTTGLQGSAAAVSNSGSSNAAVLNFTVPRGDVGPQGSPGTPGSVTIAGLGDASTIGRLVWTSATGGTVAANGANTWTKLASLSFGTVQWVGGSVLLNVSSHSQQGTFENENNIVSVSVYQSDAANANAPGAFVEILGKSGSFNIPNDGFKIVSNGHNTAFELWVRKGSTSGVLAAYEVSRSSASNLMSVTYHAASPWQQATPTGSRLNVSSNGVTASGKPVLPATATITAPTRLPNYGNDYTALVNLPASADPHINSVTALMPFAGANNSTAIVDQSIGAYDWTAYGNAKISTDQSAGGTLLLDGNGDYVRASPLAASTSGFAFGTGDFTIEMWVHLNGHNTGSVSMLYEGRMGVNGYPTIYVRDDGRLRYYVNADDRILGTNAMALNTWHHVAVSRVAGTTRLFLNGYQEGSSWSDPTDYLSSQPAIGVGGYTFSEFYLNGYVQHARVTKGVGRYSGTYAIPSYSPLPAAVTLPHASGNSTVYTVRNTGSSPVTVNAVGNSQLDGVESLRLAPGFSIVAGATPSGEYLTSNIIPKLPLTGDNLVPNGDFELDGFKTGGANGTTSISTEQFRSGTRSLKTVYHQYPALMCNSQGTVKVPCIGSDTFYLEAYVRGHSSNVAVPAGDVYLQLNFFKADGSAASTGALAGSFVNGGTALNGVWTKLSTYLTAPADAASIYMSVVAGSSVGSNIYYWDDVKCYRATLPADVVRTAGAQSLSNKTLVSPTIANAQMTYPWLSNVLFQGGNDDALSYVTSTAAAAGLRLFATGTPSAALLVKSGDDRNAFQIGCATASVNHLSVTGSAAGAAIPLYANGTDTNVGINLVPKGTGTVQAKGNPVGVKVAVPANATSTGVVGQWAADASWHYVCTAANTWRRAALSTW